MTAKKQNNKQTKKKHPAILKLSWLFNSYISKNLSFINILNVDETNITSEPYDLGSNLSELYANGII